MNYFIKKYLRDIFTSVILIVSLAVTMFCSLNVARQINAYNESNNETDREYSYVTTFSFRSIDHGNVDLKNDSEYFSDYDIVAKHNIVKSNTCNIFMDATTTLEKGMKNVPLEIIFFVNESLPYIFKSGNYIYDDSVLTVLVGKDILEYTYVENGRRYINISGNKCFVGGILESNSIVGYNEKIVLFYDNIASCLGEKKINTFITFCGNINICSNISENDVKEARVIISDRLADIGYEMAILEKSDNGYIYVSKTMSKTIANITNVVCLLNVIIIINIWIRKKHKEFAIRKIFGTSNIRIMGGLLIEFLKCIIPSCCIGIVFQYIYCVISKISFKWSYFFEGEGKKIYLFIIIVLMVTLLLHIRYINRIETRNTLSS